MLGRRKAIGFWAGDENNFRFVDPIIDYLAQYYRVKKFQFNGDEHLLKQQIQSVDLAWMEWGQGPIGPASNFDKIVPIINRIHRYEVYQDTVNYFNYKNVDRLIFVAPGVKDRFSKVFPHKYSDTQAVIIENGVDMDQFIFRDRPIGKKLIFVGRIHPVKNPSLLLQIVARLVSEDRGYTLDIYGEHHDAVYEEWFNYQVDKLGLRDNVTVHKPVTHETLAKRLSESDFILMSSIIEGMSQATVEAMACGTIPVVANYFGSELTYPKECLYLTVDEAVSKIKNPLITRQAVNKIAHDTYRLSDKLSQIQSLVDDALEGV